MRLAIVSMSKNFVVRKQTRVLGNGISIWTSMDPTNRGMEAGSMRTDTGES